MMTNPMKVIGDRIASRRNELGLTQEQLAKIVGKQRTSITNIEAGRQNLTINTLLVLSAALSLSPSELLEDIQLDGSVYERAAEIRAQINALQHELRTLLTDNESERE